MTPEMWERLKPLFEAAIEKPRGERERYIAEVCGNESELRDILVALVTAHMDPPDSNDFPMVKIDDLLPKKPTPLGVGEVLMDRFEIVRHLGGGGMGDVYEAKDRALGRIALKTIRSELADNPEIVARFKREVQLARKVVSHHVCRVHEFLEISDSRKGFNGAFLTMEFLDGVTLADKIRESGPLPWRDAWGIGIEICSGLEAIHEAGIIHRDLKSRNVMLSARSGSTCAVAMDFGLAREFLTPASEAATDFTNLGAIMGTPAYMAPEQFSGGEVGPWTDVYALGVVLYELITSKQPYPASSLAAAAVTRARPPKPASSVQAGIPRHCDGVINRCLEYEPRLRYQSAKEAADALTLRSPFQRLLQRKWVKPLAATAGLVVVLASALFIPAVRERLQGVWLSSREKHIAFLPIDPVENNPEIRALGDGLMDSLSGQFSNLDTASQTLWVVPFSEVRSRNVNDASSALLEFGATIVVKGRFERHAQAMDLKLDLIDPRKRKEIGFVDIENKAGDLVALQNEAVTRLGRLMNISVGGELVRGSARREDRSAYQDYLTALGYIQRFDKAGNLDRAITALQSAVNTDSRFALGFARLAQVYVLKFELDGDFQWLQRAQEYCKQAAALDDRIALTFVALGNVHEDTGDHDLAVQEFHRALELDPRNSDALTGMALAYRNEGRNSEAEDAYKHSAALRPGDWTGPNLLGNFYEFIGRHQDAIAQFKKGIELSPENSALYANLGAAYSGDPKMFTEAENALNKSIAISPMYQTYANLCSLYEMQYRFHESVAACQKGIQLNDQSYEIWNGLTIAYEWLKEDERANAARKRAIEILERTVESNSQNGEAQSTLAALLAKNGAKQRALDGIAISLALSPRIPYVLSEVADAYELLGDRRHAIKYLQQALRNGFPAVGLRADPEIQGVISDPRFRMPEQQ